MSLTSPTPKHHHRTAACVAEVGVAAAARATGPARVHYATVIGAAYVECGVASQNPDPPDGFPLSARHPQIGHARQSNGRERGLVGARICTYSTYVCTASTAAAVPRAARPAGLLTLLYTRRCIAE